MAFLKDFLTFGFLFFYKQSEEAFYVFVKFMRIIDLVGAMQRYFKFSIILFAIKFLQLLDD
jgi:hypothetical protein